MKTACFQGFYGGRNRTRTCDPIDVNDVLYQLSHATIFNCRRLDDKRDYTIFRRGCQGFCEIFKIPSKPPRQKLPPKPSKPSKAVKTEKPPAIPLPYSLPPCLSSGRRTVNVDPMPRALRTSTLPPQRSTMRLTRLRPRPLPWVAWAVSPW